ncbi:MAG: Maf family protein [Clostridia bacterium]
MKYILASTSPRRQELFKQVTSEFDIIPSFADENLSLYFSTEKIKKALDEEPEILVKKLAQIKAEEVARHVENGIVVGSDTGVFFEKQMLGKPKDALDAVKMLKELSGKSHKVITGVCVVKVENFKTVKTDIEFDETEVVFNTLSDELIEKYVASKLCFGKAGGYGIQDGYPLVEKYVGSYENVMGFPIELVGKMIKNIE